ncbi:hypothetical protein HDR60_03705 [bacterium]|nr:hypothetical protein [bacterium]
MLGGGKTFVKSVSYISFCILFFFSFCNNFVNASIKSKKTSSVKKIDSDKFPECPVSMILNRVVDKSLGGTVFYMAKNKRCLLPNNVSVRKWNETNIQFYPNSLKVLPLWIPETSAFYLVCNSEYVEKTINKVKTCVNISQICPLGEVVEKSGGDYLHPFTNDICFEPENAMIRNVRGDENTRSLYVADKDAFLFECPPNYYSVENIKNSFLRIECEACPLGLKSPAGSTSKNDCVRSDVCLGSKVLVSLENGNTECRVCDVNGAVYNMVTKSCDVKDGYECKENGTLCVKKNDGNDSVDGIKDIITIAFSVICGLFMGSGKKFLSKLSTIFSFLSDMKDK